ncbi:hypothetical protein Pen01_52360 [Phytomonospora endophytica]|nr:hypothetical protein Pen01_52360 [Phytomonospora endophytica]
MGIGLRVRVRVRGSGVVGEVGLALSGSAAAGFAACVGERSEACPEWGRSGGSRRGWGTWAVFLAWVGE